MVRLFIIGIDCLPVWILVIPVIAILQFFVFKQRGFVKFLMSLVFAFYLIGVFFVTGIPTFDSLRIELHFQWIPLIDIVNEPVGYLKNTLLNIILFTPMGFLLPALWREYRSFRATLFSGFATSLLIEILQIFTFRLTDVDDLITNTIGTVAGYYLWKMAAKRIVKKPSEGYEAKKRFGRYEPIIILAVMFLIHFFLKPLVLKVVWDLVLSSSWWERIR